MSQPEDVLERFLEVLLQQITATRPEYLTAPFTVAEIYQDLVPYRTHRDLIGVEMNGDYEEVLFRMLAGEGDYLLLDSGVARKELQRELATTNPNMALFREFAAADVRFHPSRVPLGAAPAVRAEVAEPDTLDPDVAGPRAEEVEADQEAEMAVDLETEVAADLETEAAADLEPEASEETSQTPSAVEDGVVGHIETVAAPSLSSREEPEADGNVSTEAEPSDVLTVCHWCREDLPMRDSIHFCPFCGSDLRPSPCRECGNAMEARWQFCVSCGTAVRG